MDAVPRRRDSRTPVRTGSRVGLARRPSQSLPGPTVLWPTGAQGSIPSADPVDIASKENLIKELNANPDLMGYLSLEISSLQDVFKKLTKLTDLIPCFPPPAEAKSGRFDPLETSSAPIALTQAFALLTAQHTQMCLLLQQATTHVTLIHSRLAYIESERDNLIKCEKAFHKMQKEYLQIKPNKTNEQLLQEDIKYVNEKRNLELQRFRLRAKMEELKLSSTQSANQFLLQSFSAYHEFIEQAPFLFPSKGLLDTTKASLQKHNEVMTARLNVCDSVQADLEVEVDINSLMRGNPAATGVRDLDGVVDTEPEQRVTNKKGTLFNPTSSSFGPVGVSLQDNILTLKYEKGEEVMISCMLCTVKESRELERRFVFCVVTPQRTHFLQADSMIEMQRWMSAIQSSIMAALDNSSGFETKKDNSANLQALWAIEGNRMCADCDSADPEWCSINMGCLICMACSGVHRSLGVHISKVRSLKLDQFGDSLLGFMLAIGNIHHNSIWEANLPKTGDRHNGKRREEFIKLKYNVRAFVPELESNEEKQIEDVLQALTQKNYVKLLSALAAGQNINHRMNVQAGRTLLHMAVENDDSVAVQLLIQNDADVLATENRGWIPLCYAAFMDNTDAVRVLLERGGSNQIKMVDLEGMTPLDLAKRYNPGNSATVTLLHEFATADEEKARKRALEDKEREIKDQQAWLLQAIKKGDHSRALKISTWGRVGSRDRSPGGSPIDGDIILQGFLQKKSPTGNNRFQDRYFELLPNMLIYRKKKGGDVAGEIRLSDIEAGRLVERAGSKLGEFELDVRTLSESEIKKYGIRRTFTICSTTTNDAGPWLSAILKRVEVIKQDAGSGSFSSAG